MPNTPPGLAGFNALDPGDAEKELLSCCASHAFAEAVAARRPFQDAAALADAAGAAVRELTWPQVLEALAAHPRIGERARGPARSRPGPGRSSPGVEERAARGPGRGQPGLRGALRPRLPDLRHRPDRRRDARPAARATGQRRGDRAAHGPRGARQDHPAAASAKLAGGGRDEPLHARAGRGHRPARRRASPSGWSTRAAVRRRGAHRRRRPDRGLGRPERACTGSSSTPAAIWPDTFYPEVVITFTVDRPRPALPRAAAAQPVRLLHLPRELDVRSCSAPTATARRRPGVVRVVRDGGRPPPQGPQRQRRARPATWTAVHLTGDNAAVLPTDTQKNTVYAFAKQHGVGPDRGLRAAAGPALRRGAADDPPRPGGDRGVRLGADPAAAALLRPPRRRGAHLRGPPRRRRPHHRGVRAEGPGRAQLDRLGVPRLRPGRVHHPPADHRPRPGHRGDRPLAAPGDGRRLRRLVRRAYATPARRRSPRPTACRCSRPCTRWASGC